MAPAKAACWPCAFWRLVTPTSLPEWRHDKRGARPTPGPRTPRCQTGQCQKGQSREEQQRMTEPNLAQRLGYSADAKLVVVNADDLGSCHSANVGVFECLATGTVTSATLMVPCPWAREASSRYRGEDIGVHLTVNAEYELYRWGPITYAPSLLGGDGGFPRTVEDVWDHADLDEVRRECRAQIERAILWGFDVSHLDSHMRTLQLRPAVSTP